MNLARSATEFYKKAFCPREVYRSLQPTGAGLHVHPRIGESLVIVADDNLPREKGRLEAHYSIASPRPSCSLPRPRNDFGTSSTITNTTLR